MSTKLVGGKSFHVQTNQNFIDDLKQQISTRALPLQLEDSGEVEHEQVSAIVNYQATREIIEQELKELSSKLHTNYEELGDVLKKNPKELKELLAKTRSEISRVVRR
ncbi:MAG: hypothetical protein AAGJ35_14915, partial [Myxococcota bacterium]